jgi:hypothetical protein
MTLTLRPTGLSDDPNARDWTIDENGRNEPIGASTEIPRQQIEGVPGGIVELHPFAPALSARAPVALVALAALGDRLGFAAAVLRKRPAHLIDLLEASLRTPANVAFVSLTGLDEFSLRRHGGRPFRCWLTTEPHKLVFQGALQRLSMLKTYGRDKAPASARVARARGAGSDARRHGALERDQGTVGTDILRR